MARMAEFAWRAIDAAGRERNGQMQAESADAARTRLEARRFYVVAVDKAVAGASPSLVAQLTSRTRKLSSRELTLFTRQFATLVQVMPIEEALRTIARQNSKPKSGAILNAVHEAVLQGYRLADAMKLDGSSFPPLYRAMVAAGEATGTLPEILDRLADLHERQAAVRGKVITALAYPMVLAVVASGVVLGLMLFVIPRIVDQFDMAGQKLPLLTRIIIDLSRFIGGWWWLMLLALAGAAALFAQAMASPQRRIRIDRALLRMPVLGRLIRDLHAAQMARTLATMVASRLPLVEGIAITTPTLRNRALRAASAAITEDIRGGNSLSSALRHAAIFPPILVYMVSSGEAAGRLDEMLERAADYLEREFDLFTSTLLSLLEPLVIVVMGAVVAVIVLAILLPVLQLDTLAGMR
jgi:general secretion pathway protein F